VLCLVLLTFGGWNSPSVVLGTPSHSLFFLGVLVLAAYVPLHFWRRFSDRRRGGGQAPPAELPQPLAAPAVGQA